MRRYSRPYSYGWSRYNRYGHSTKYYRRGTIGRAAAGAAAAKRSDKTETYSCTINGICTSQLKANTQLTVVKAFHPYQGGLTPGDGVPNDNNNLVHGGAINDRGFRMKCAVYDEMKLDSMKITLSPAQLLTNNNVSFTLCTMWDRKASPKECGYVGGDAWMANGSMPSPPEIFNNEGTIKSILTGNSIYGFKRYCKASTIMEKGGFHDSSILYNFTAGESPLKYMYADAWIRGALPFSPAMFLTIYSPATLTADTTIALTYKVEYTFTFRNPKSDMDWFLTVEAPGYVNPDSKSITSEKAKTLIRDRATPKELNDVFEEIYQLKGLPSKPLSEVKSTFASLFATREDDKETAAEIKREDTMEIEDDPGTA